MGKKKYQGAGIGISRMNEILRLISKSPMTLLKISISANMCERSAKNYVKRLGRMEKLTRERGEIDRRMVFYKIVPGATMIPEIEPKEPRRRPLKLVKEKTGPKPKIEPKKSLNVANPTVRVLPAKQIGVQRDPLIAMFFGQAA